MEFKIGQIVRFNGTNYVILDVQKNVFNGQERTFLHIRDIVTNDLINVDASQVALVDLNGTNQKQIKTSFDDFEESANSAEQDLIENKTEYLNSLFSSISNENTEEFFNLDSSSEITDDKIERIAELDTSDSIDLKRSTVTNDFVQNFSLPRTATTIQPRRKREMMDTPVDATFSDLQVVGVIPTTEFVKNDPQKLHEPTQIIQPRRELQSEHRQDDFKFEGEFIKPSFEKNFKNDDTTFNFQPQPEIEKPKPDEIKLDDDITRLIKEDATDVNTIIEPGFSESTEDDLSITSETKKIILEGLSNKANKFKEKQREILATGPINTEKLMSKLAGGKDETSILDEITSDAINHQSSSTDALMGELNATPQDIINKSKIYGSFKKMSNWFITLIVLLVFVPIVGIVVKIAGNFESNMTSPMAMANIFSYNLNINANSFAVLSTFISTILVVIATPVLLLTTLIYGTIYVVLTMKRQYRRLAFFNYQMQKESGSIEALQDFSNESSVFMLKLHNENKEMKKQIKKLTKLSGMNIMKNISDQSKKEVH